MSAANFHPLYYLLFFTICCALLPTHHSTTLCTDVLQRSAQLLLLPVGFPLWSSDQVPAFVWWGDPANVRIVPQLQHRADSPYQDPIHDCLAIADGTDSASADDFVLAAHRLHVCLRLAPANISLGSTTLPPPTNTHCVSPTGGIKDLTSLDLDVTSFGEATKIEAWIQMGPRPQVSADEKWKCCVTFTMVIAPRAHSDVAGQLRTSLALSSPGAVAHKHRKLTGLRNVRRASEWMAQSSMIDEKPTSTTSIDNDAFEVGYLAGVEHDHWWFHPSKSPLAYLIFDTNMLYSTGDGYKSHQSALLPEWSTHYASSVLRYCHALRGRSCHSFIEFGSASCYVTTALRDVALSNGAQPPIDFLAIEAAQSGVDACKKRGIPLLNVLQHDLRLPLVHRAKNDDKKKYDVAVCTEVAEHIEPPFASQLVLSLVQSSDIVWFSSALPRSQKPWYPFNHVHHMNEQHDAFWINLFYFFGFDYVRPVPVPNGRAAEELSAKDDQALRQRGRIVFFNMETVQVSDERLQGFAKDSCRGAGAATGAAAGVEQKVGGRDVCSQILDVYGKDDDGKYERWLNAWSDAWSDQGG